MLSMDLFTAAGRGTAPPRAQPYPRSYQSNSFVRRRVPPPTLFRFLVPTSTDERIRVEQAKPGPGLRAEPGSPKQRVTKVSLRHALTTLSIWC
jgi:hypothetical protein